MHPKAASPYRVLSACVAYLIIYAVASFLDLWSTRIALTAAGVREGNLFVVDAQGNLTSRALMITFVGGFIMLSCVVFAAVYADRMDDYWLAHPVASFRKICLNPWSRTTLAFSPLQMLSLALGFALLRVLAAINNMLIYFFGFGPIGGLIDLVAKRTSEAAAFVIVILLLFYLLAIAVSPQAAKVILSWRTSAIGELANSADN